METDERGVARITRVREQLDRYEHPWFEFEARPKGEGVEVSIQFKLPCPGVHTYYFDVHPRDIEHPQFPWTFQKQLYDCLHDYVIEVFARNPQKRDNG